MRLVLFLAALVMAYAGGTDQAPASEPQYGLIYACSDDAQKVCVRLEDQWGPYEDLPTCHARLAVLWEETKDDVLGARLGTFRYHLACGTLEQLRGFWPGAFKGVGMDEERRPELDAFRHGNSAA